MLVEGKALTKIFKRGFLEKTVAVENVDIFIDKSETLILIGESGSGKTTLGKLLLYLLKPDCGEVVFDGIKLSSLSQKKLRTLRRRMQLIPQHPEDALNPRWKVRRSLLEPAEIHGFEVELEEILRLVGLKGEQLERYPKELSGGELQRVVIARAISMKPDFIVADEPTSMLDVSVQASIVNLLMELQNEYGTSYLYITHEIELAKAIAERVAVMLQGEIVEEGVDVLEEPLHPFSKLLIEGDLPECSKAGRGCKFSTFCKEKLAVCNVQKPELVDLGKRRVRCHLYD